MSSNSDIHPDEHSVPPTGRHRTTAARVESCCGIRPSRKLELEQSLDSCTQASVGVCEEKGCRETHPSQGAFARGHIHGSGIKRRRRKGRKKEKESLSNLSSAPDALVRNSKIRNEQVPRVWDRWPGSCESDHAGCGKSRVWTLLSVCGQQPGLKLTIQQTLSFMVQ
jgi:hypothetical protein